MGKKPWDSFEEPHFSKKKILTKNSEKASAIKVFGA
jgi:hypothetical protein